MRRSPLCAKHWAATRVPLRSSWRRPLAQRWCGLTMPCKRCKEPRMRLAEIDRGDSFSHRALIGFISLVSGMRLPDAARVAFYHQDYLEGTLGNWTHATMRGESTWSIS